MRPRALLVGVAAFVSTACIAAAPADKPKGVPARPAPPESSRVVPLPNAGFESAPRAGERCPEHWGCTMHSDPDSFVFRIDIARPAQGKQSLCIERVRNEPWGLATQVVRDAGLRGRRLRFSIALRIDRADGAGAGPWAVVHGPSGNLVHEERLVTATKGWERVSVEFPVGPTAQMVEVGATLQGAGRACIDDARLEVLAD